LSASIVRNYTDMELRGSLIHGKELSDFPATPRRNEQVLINGVLWVYTMVAGSLTWFPLNTKKNTHTHTQALASQDWTVQHGMNTQDFVLGVYGPDNNLVMPSSIQQVTDNSFHITFTEPVAGRAVAFFNTAAFAPTVVTQSVTANSLNISNGLVTADQTGLKVNGNQVPVLNAEGHMDYGTL